MGRAIGGIVLGIVVVGIVVVALQAVSVARHPLPEGVDPLDSADAAAFDAYLEELPPSAWSLSAGAELLGALLGGLVAGSVARWRERLASGIVVGLALLGSVHNWISFTHPTAFIAAQVVGYPLVLALVWSRLGRRRRARATG